MRLGLVVPGGFDPGGREGTIPALVDLAGELARRHEVWVFAAAGLAGAARYRMEGIEVTQLGPARTVSAVDLGVGFARWARRSARFDLLHAFWANSAALLAGVYARCHAIPSVVSLGGGEAVWLPALGYGGAGTRRGRFVTGAVLRLADAVTAGSAFALDSLPPHVATRASIVPLGVEIARFAAPPERSSGPPWRLVHVANLNGVKDQPTLLKALRRVVERLGDVQLDCVGEDTLGGEIARLAHALGLGERVSFHGYMPQEALAAFYRRAHLNVLASQHESQGVVILEAAAAGLPTVGTRVGLLATLDPGAARAVPVGDANALGDAIAALLVDEAARRAMGEAAQRFAVTHDIVGTARAFEAIYERVWAARR